MEDQSRQLSGILARESANYKAIQMFIISTTPVNESISLSGREESYSTVYKFRTEQQLKKHILVMYSIDKNLELLPLRYH